MTSSKNSRPWQIVPMLVLSLIGTAMGVILAHEYYQVRGGMAGFKSLCHLGAKLNCDAVAASSYSEVIWGIPLASFATGWMFALMVLVGFYIYSADFKRQGAKVLFLVSAVAALFSLSYLLVMMALIKTYCLYCLGLDAVTVSLLILSTLLLKSQAATALENGKLWGVWKLTAGVIAGSLVLSIVLLKGFEGETADASTRKAMVDQVLNTPPVAVAGGEEFPSIGPKDAPVVITEFSDFQCPFCRVGALIMNTVIEAGGGKVRLVFRGFPLDSSCNPEMKRPMHPVSCEATRAALCAHKQGKFQVVYEELFERQGDLAKTHPTEMALSLPEIDASAFKACMSDPATAGAVSRDIQEAIRLGIQSTPTFFINGRKVEGVFPLPVWQELIERLKTP